MTLKNIFLILFLFELGWAQAPTDLPVPAAGSTASPNSAADAVNTVTSGFELSPQIDYVYDSTGKKDPFKPYKAPRIRGDDRPAAIVDPLSLVEVSQLQLVAVMWNTSKPRAVVKDMQNRNFILFKNMRIGRNEGVVVDIREGEIVIVEKFDDGFGNTVREAKVLEIKPVESTAGG